VLRSTTLVSLLMLLTVPAAATTHTVSIIGFSFNPPSLTVATGDSVIWVNNSALSHTSTSGTPCTANGLWDSPFLGPGDDFTFTFAAPGTFPYFCRPHCGSGMTGTITVTPPTPVEPTTWGRIKSLYGS